MTIGETYTFYPIKCTGEYLMAGEGGYWVNKSNGKKMGNVGGGMINRKILPPRGKNYRPGVGRMKGFR